VFRNGSELYIHRIAYDKEFFGGLSPEEAQRKYQEATEEVRSYLNEMGIDEKYYYRMLRTSSGEADKLSFEEAAQLDGWVPAVQEWLIAKCGNFEAFQQNIGNCWTNAYLVAQRDAYKREFGEGRSVSPPIAPQIGVAKQWNHNGSTLTLEANGASGRFVFIEPRVGLREVGVTQGMVAFEGKRSGNVYKGTAYVFSRICGPVGYPVSGSVAQDEQSITLRGYAPYVDAQCRRAGGRDGILVFRLTDR
jgi:hypothetical protein